MTDRGTHTTLPAQSTVVRLILRCTQCRHVDGRTQAGALLCHSCYDREPKAKAAA